MTPEEVRRLSMDTFAAMVDYQKEVERASR